MTAYYNENDPYAAQWLRKLIAAGHIAPGEVDERSILDVRADDIRGFKQCHFFAGIGVWSHALRLAGWPDDREVWTGSCPRQPFSTAGKRGGVEDERHLWPEFFRLISIARPRAVFGEQVASKDGLAWLDIVSADLERAGYACGAVDTCAAGFGAPHIRQRLYFVADMHGSRRGARRAGETSDGGGSARLEPSGLCVADSELGDAEQPGLQEQRSDRGTSREEVCRDSRETAVRTSASVDDAQATAWESERKTRAQPGPVNGFWRDADWLLCIDGKARPVEPGTFPLAHGAPARVGRLRAYGNAINARQAAGFISAFLAPSEDDPPIA